MVSIVLLAACGTPPADVDPEVVDAPDIEGSLRIATTPARAERTRAQLLEAPMPRGSVVVRDCFEAVRNEEARRPPTQFGARPSLRAPASAPAPPPPPPAAPSGMFERLQDAVGGRGRAQEGESAAADAPSASAAERPRRAKKAEQNAQLEALGYVLPSEEPAPEPEPSVVRGADFDDSASTKAVRPGDPSLDWGATVHLSNDDSMSLASAQRVLWAMAEGRPISPAQVRPHELLNYFSFDTAGAPSTDAFSVLGSAEQRGDTLTLALAVHGANPPRQPLDLTLVLDRSGSMNAEGRMAYVKRGLTLLTEQLQGGDRVDVVLFDGAVCSPLEGFVAGRDDPSLLSGVIRQLRPRGSTDLDAGLREAYRIQRSREAADTHRRNRRILLLTDAQLNTGNVDEHLVSDVGAAYESEGIGLTGIGVGRDFNDSMLDRLTEKGKGAYVYLGSEAVVDRVFGSGFDQLTRTIAHDVRFSLDLPPSLAMQRFYGEEASTNPEDVQPIHYYADTTQLFLQDLTIRDGQAVRTDPVTMRIEYRDAATGEPSVQELHTTVGALLDGSPHNLRKGLALMRFSDAVLAGAMGADPCGPALQAFRDEAALLRDDAEIAYVGSLLGQRCGVDMSRVVGVGVPLKVTVDADLAVPELSLTCRGRTHVESLTGSDTVARFHSVRPGSCVLTLQGTVPMQAAIEVPEQGGAMRCLVRGGRISCS